MCARACILVVGRLDSGVDWRLAPTEAASAPTSQRMKTAGMGRQGCRRECPPLLCVCVCVPLLLFAGVDLCLCDSVLFVDHGAGWLCQLFLFVVLFSAPPAHNEHDAQKTQPKRNQNATIDIETRKERKRRERENIIIHGTRSVGGW